jgi:hypothetical protein
MLRVDPARRQRCEQIAANLEGRLAEAIENGWLGEAQGLQVSLEAAKNKLGSLDRQARGGSPVDLGLPTIRDNA